MLRTPVLRTLASILLAFVAAGVPAQTRIPGPSNAGFESAEPLSGWAVEGPAGAVSVEAASPYEGGKSLRIRSAEAIRLRVVSEPLKLEVGKIYRVRGRIRAENLTADPFGRYPTPLPATIGMASFPFTMHSTPVGGTRGWTRSEAVFIATQATDRIVLNFGTNGTVSGTAWFDDLAVEEVQDVTQWVPYETVRWHGPAFRYTDRGWIFVHIEGSPYERGYQYGKLLAPEIAAYLEKLAITANNDNPRAGWDVMRRMTDALMLRLFDEEYLVEMRGIADGAAAGGATFQGTAVDFLDIVTINSAVDLGQIPEALNNTATPLTGRSFRKDEEEAAIQERLHKCSSFLANGPASKDGRIVFSQIFMWAGYTGVHWDLVVDVVPEKGHRLVYQTFPGGIHSGADFYINASGIMLGETTVLQTPFNPHGEPQASRIRKAAQYASSIDEVVRILTTKNNGLYTNDWLIGDAKTDETAILLLGTYTHKLWRSGKGEFPGGTTGFLWSVNNAKDPEVRKEYVPDPNNAPFDVVFGPVNRDLAFVEYYEREKGKIDAVSAAKVLATSPINRPHACDGKVTTSEMAERLVFLAHYGKTTQREKFPERGSRRMPDLPNAIPHLTLGHTAFSPVVITEMLRNLKEKQDVPPAPAKLKVTGGVPAPEKKKLWRNSVFPAADADNWFPSGTTAYWNILNGLPGDAGAARSALAEQMGDLQARLLYTIDREGDLAPSATTRRYDGYKTYVIPRVRGTVLLHQLRLELGNEKFLEVMEALHDRWSGKGMSTAQFLAFMKDRDVAGAPALAEQWIRRADLADPAISAVAEDSAGTWIVRLTVRQGGKPFGFRTTVAIEGEAESRWEVVAVEGGESSFRFAVPWKPIRLVFNAGNDVPVRRPDFSSYANLFDDFKNVRIVYGTRGQVEANRTLALRYQGVIGDQFTEDLLPVVQDNSVTAGDLASHDLVIMGTAGDNTLADTVARALGCIVGKGMFQWMGRTMSDPSDGVVIAGPSPFNPKRMVYVVMGNSAVQLWHMTKRHTPLPGWALWKKDVVVEKGFVPAAHHVVEF
jgi:hypothetical protein